jgi:hypothetical protein
MRASQDKLTAQSFQVSSDPWLQKLKFIRITIAIVIVDMHHGDSDHMDGFTF